MSAAFTPPAERSSHHDGRRSSQLVVPDNPIIPFIEGDGTGRDIWRASVRVLDAAVEKAYGGKRKIAWYEVLAGEKAFKLDQQLAARRDGRGVPQVPRRHQGAAHDAHRRRHPLAQRRAPPAARPLRLPPPGALVRGRAEPGEAPAATSTWSSSARTRRTSTPASSSRPRAPTRRRSSPSSRRSSRRTTRRSASRRRPASASSRSSREGTERLVRAAIEYALDQQAEERHVRPQGQHHEVHRGRLHALGLRPRRSASSATRSTPGTRGRRRRPPRARTRRTPSRRRRSRAGKVLVKDAIADITLQQVLTRAEGVRRHRDAEPERRLPVRRARGAGRRHRHRAGRQHQLRHRPRHLRGDARHRAEVRRPRQGEPGLASSSRGEMMLRHLGWNEAADLVIKGMDGAIAQQARHLRLRAADGGRHRDQVLASSATTSSPTC